MLWRLRLEICKQLNDFTQLLPAVTVLESILPVYTTLLMDPYEVIRKQAYVVMMMMMMMIMEMMINMDIYVTH